MLEKDQTMEQGQFNMAKFRMRIEQLVLKKSAERGTLIDKRELAESTGVPYSTLARLYSQDFERMDAENVLKLKKYFNCTLDELIEVVE